MPGLFKSRKQSKEAKRRFEHLMIIAKDNPNKVFDLSECELSSVPSSLYVQCRVFLTESLLLHTNMLKSIKDGGKLMELLNLRILDLHSNRINQLPDEIGVLINLQVLNVESNKLAELPSSIGEMKKLQSLLCRDNVLTCLPKTIEKMSSLRTLDISGTNQVFYLPKAICQVRTLEALLLARPHLMEYPPPMICQEGLEAMQKFICKDCGVEYIPPSHALLKVLDQCDGQSSSTSKMKETLHNQEMTSLQLYEQQKEEKRRQHMELEKQMAESQAQLAMLSSKGEEAKKKDYLLMKKDFENLDKTIQQQQEKKEKERKDLFEILKKVEHDASNLVQDLLKVAENARNHEALLETMEQQRLEQEHYFRVTQDDLDKLRKEETVAAMRLILANDDKSNQAIQKYLSDQDHSRKMAQKSLGEDNERLQAHLMKQHSNQDDLVKKLMTEEHLQKEAFAILQFQRDAVQMRLLSQISQLQEELVRLTQMEAKRKMMKMELEQETVNLIRNELTDLLIQLLKEKDQREKTLCQRLIEMERQRENDQVDFWLVQYQRLLDSKPEILIQKEHGLEDLVINLLRRADATQYIPNFARHKVSSDNILTLSERQLQSIGVFQVGIRNNIMREIESLIAQRKKVDPYSPPLSPDAEEPPSTSVTLPSAPLPPVQPSPINDFKNECVVCMDEESDCVFLPCGHVCCCFLCSVKLTICPMCRVKIEQKVKMFRSS